MQMLRTCPSMNPMASTGSKKRRRSIEPLETSKILGLPLVLALPDALCGVSFGSNSTSISHSEQNHGDGSGNNGNNGNNGGNDASERRKASKNENENENEQDRQDARDPHGEDEADDSPALMRRSLMGLSLQLKLKTMMVEAWASDMNSVVIERNLFAIAKELALMKEMGVYEESTCVRFLEVARHRMTQLLSETERGEELQMDAHQMWTMARIQAQEKMHVRASSPTSLSSPSSSSSSSASEFPLLSSFDASSRDISVLWKAMSIARDRGAQLWHENKPEQALPFLVAADSYMKRFTLKYQRLKIDHAMLDAVHGAVPLSSRLSIGRTSNLSSSSSESRVKSVSFADVPEVMGIADAEVDRTPISPTRPSKLESLLLRTSREFPTPGF